MRLEREDCAKDDRIEVFNRDIATNEGYLYTTNIGVSSQMATRRSLDTIIRVGQFEGKSLLDVGCGDGFYTFQYWEMCRRKRLVGLDAAEKAIEIARSRTNGRPIEFHTGISQKLPFPDNSFDIVQLQSILHHDDDPQGSIREAFRVAPVVLIHEPNGNNLGLKIIEKLSPYHREHGERSFSTWRMKQWIHQAGGRVEELRFAGFVAMFCPDWMAHTMKAVEPIVENVPVLRALGSSVYVIRAVRA